MMMASICFLGFAFYRLNTNFAAESDSSRRLKETKAVTQEIADLTKLLHYMMTEAKDKDSVIGQKDAVIEEKMSVIQEKDAAINEKGAVIEEKDSLIKENESAISKQQLQITNLTQRLRRGAAKAQTNQGEIRHLKSKLEKAIASAREAIATENTVINQNAAGIDKTTMANQIIKDLQASLAAIGREAHEWRTEAYIAIVRKMPPSQRGLSLFGMDPRNFMPRVPTIQSYNPSDNFLGPAGAPSFSINPPPYPFPTSTHALGPAPDTYAENWLASKDCSREGEELD